MRDGKVIGIVSRANLLQGLASGSAVVEALRIGYNRAARLIEEMERAGLVSAMQSNGNREVLVPNNE